MLTHVVVCLNHSLQRHANTEKIPCCIMNAALHFFLILQINVNVNFSVNHSKTLARVRQYSQMTHHVNVFLFKSFNNSSQETHTYLAMINCFVYESYFRDTLTRIRPHTGSFSQLIEYRNTNRSETEILILLYKKVIYICVYVTTNIRDAFNNFDSWTYTRFIVR